MLTVADSGPGFDLDLLRRRPGLGIISMKERAQLIGGTLTVRSEPGANTVIEVSVPRDRTSRVSSQMP